MTLVKEIQQWYLGFADNILNYYINKNILLHLDQILYPELPKQAVCST